MLSRRFLFLFILAVGLMPVAAHAAAPDAKSRFPTPVIALIDMQRILEESLAAKSVQKQLDTQRSKFQKQTEGEENELRQAENDLSKSHNQMTSDLYAENEQQLRQKVLAIERRVQARRKALDQGFTESMNEVRTNLLTIVESVARDHGVNLVIVKQQALWADKGFDVTDEVLDQLNKKLPQVTVKLALDDEK